MATYETYETDADYDTMTDANTTEVRVNLANSVLFYPDFLSKLYSFLTQIVFLFINVTWSGS